MEGKEISTAVIDEAKRKAAAVIDAAEDKKRRLLEEAEGVLARKKDEVVARARLEAEQIVARCEMLARLEAKKAILAVKQQTVERVYGEAASKINNMTDNLYRAFIESLISEYGEEDDEVVISRQDAKRLNYDWLSKFSVSIDRRLTLGNEHHDDRGGVVLRGKHYDKRLTLTALIGEIRAATEGEVAGRLFGNQ